MAYDENGNYSEDQQPQQDPNAAWNNASNEINKWTSSNNPQGRNINWEAAQNVWNQSGGDLNKVYSQSNSWLNPAQQSQTQSQSAAPAWGKDQYEAFRNDWLGQGFGSQTSSDKLQQVASKYGIRIDKGQHAFAPDGSYIGDMIGDVGGRNTLQFLRGSQGHATTDKLYGGKSSKPKVVTPPGPGNKPPAGGGGAGGGGGTGGGGMVGGALGAQAQELYNMLMERARRGENVDPNDPIIKAQTDAYRSEGTAARRNFLADQAEAGGPYGNMRSEERRSAEQLGKSVGGFQAGAMQQELGARRQQIEHALDQAGEFMTNQQRMSLQNELTRLQLAQQESQFGRNLKQQGSQFDRDLGFRYAGLNQADNQFRDRLGFDYGDRSNYWDAINRGLL